MSYCSFANALPSGSTDPNKHYHDHEYGFPLEDDNALFGRLLLEINQAGLSWTLMLKKQENFRASYSGFEIAQVAAYDDGERARLLADAGIVRNRLKINATIHNAQQILRLQHEYGSFKAWLDAQHPLPLPQWIKTFKKQQFKFIGGEIIGEFLMSCGYLPGAHSPDCPIYSRILAANPPWLSATKE